MAIGQRPQSFSCLLGGQIPLSFAEHLISDHELPHGR
jgi:hypothetical protein